MAIPAWPTDVPYTSTADALGLPRIAEPPLASEMNSGTVRQRRKYTLRIAEMKVSILMTAAQWQTFRAFHMSIGNGAARFTMPIWNGSHYVTKTVQIKDQPDMTIAAFDRRLVGMTIRVETL